MSEEKVESVGEETVMGWAVEVESAAAVEAGAEIEADDEGEDAAGRWKGSVGRAKEAEVSTVAKGRG